MYVYIYKLIKSVEGIVIHLFKVISGNPYLCSLNLFAN